MERRLDYKNRITKTGRLSRRTSEELGRSKKINENGKINYEEAI